MIQTKHGCLYLSLLPLLQERVIKHNYQIGNTTERDKIRNVIFRNQKILWPYTSYDEIYMTRLYSYIKRAGGAIIPACQNKWGSHIMSHNNTQSKYGFVTQGDICLNCRSKGLFCEHFTFVKRLLKFGFSKMIFISVLIADTVCIGNKQRSIKIPNSKIMGIRPTLHYSVFMKWFHLVEGWTFRNTLYCIYSNLALKVDY